MKNGISKTAKWGIALIALMALAMGISGVASANRSSVVIADQHTFANTVLLQDNINTLAMLQTTATPAATQAQQTPAATQAQQTPAATQAPQATPAPQTGQTGGTTGQDNTNIDIASLPNGYFTYFGYLDRSESDRFVISGQDIELGNNGNADSGLLRGEYVRVEGIVRGDGKLVARSVQRVSSTNQAGDNQAAGSNQQSGNNQAGAAQGGTNQSNDFLFVGRVESSEGDNWKVGGVQVRLSEDVANRDSLSNGDRVVVAGRIMGDRNWLATSITSLSSSNTQANNAQSGSQAGSSQSGSNQQSGNNQSGNNQSSGQFFFLRGNVDKNNPLTIAGHEIRISSQLMANSGSANQEGGDRSASWLRAGNVVTVRGAIDENGVWRADSITSIGRAASTLFIVGILEDDNPISIRGLQFESNAASQTLGNMSRGTRVQILATPISGNRWMVVRAGQIGYNPRTTNFGDLAQLQNEDGQVTIWHYQGGSSGNSYSLKLNVRKARLHILEHGDTLGACS